MSSAAPPRPARVLQVTGPAAGGLKRHVERLIDRLPALGFETVLAAPTRSTASGAPAYAFEVGDRPRPGSDLRAVRQLRTAVARWQPNLIHAHGVKAALLTLLAFPTGSPRIVVTYHNRWLGGPLTLPLRFLAPRARTSIAVSEAVHKSLIDAGVHPARLQIIPNGIDPETFVPARLRPPEPFTCLFLGRLTEEKGIPLLLEVAARLAARTDLRILVAGDGPLRPVVQAATKAPNSILEYVGPQTNVLPLFHRAHLVVMPSLSEGLPMTALEGMACGLPLLASATGGIPELVQDGRTGVLLHDRAPAHWTRSLLDLAANPNRATALGEAGRRRVEAEFSEAVMLERIAVVYREALVLDPRIDA